MEKLCCLFNYSEMARVTGVPINFLLNRGQQIKVMSQLLRKSGPLGYICPTERVKKNDGEIGYEGAFVLNPEIGFYEDPIATLDFASLYPSIMIAHNLCYTTLIRPDQLMRLNIPKEDVTVTTEGNYFVKASKRPGLLPEILIELLAARKRAKNDLKK
jgi:DNA polymerase delta subunit 1